MIILHAITKELWNEYEGKEYYGEDSLDRFGFIHCSDIETYKNIALNFKMKRKI